MKDLLKWSSKATGRKYYTLDQLVTLLTEIEAVINTRPSMYVYEDFVSGFILTPADFLVSNRKPHQVITFNNKINRK